MNVSSSIQKSVINKENKEILESSKINVTEFIEQIDLEYVFNVNAFGFSAKTFNRKNDKHYILQYVDKYKY